MGAIAWGKTCSTLLAAYHDGTRIGDTLDLPEEMATGGIEPSAHA
jgi:asparaginase (EC 3.5.1.1)